ncbi:MAG: response regulator [Candidatus Sulfotelmatobacter sp.]|jgi:DNA-binding response OmpR family regulator/outer membrane protein OmpA-like peptidoglycan-associated protein
MRILIAEDDEALARFVRQGLEGEHYSVDVLPDGEQARAAATQFEYDLVILDLNLPKLDGVSVLRHLRSKKPSLPVLVLTQRTRVEDRVQCLDTGADDYLAKPFSFSELSARIRALVRRSHLPSESVLIAADLKLDRVQRLVERSGRRIDLTGKEFSLLEYLLLNAGRRVTRAMIIEHVWNLTFDTTTNVVDVYINYASSQVDQRKVGKLAMAIQVAFQELGVFPVSSTQIPVDINEPMPFSTVQAIENAKHNTELGRVSSPPEDSLSTVSEEANLTTLQAELQEALQHEIILRTVALHRETEGLVISLREFGFFDSGSAVLKPSALPALDRIASILAVRTCRLRIEGHTDNVPIHTGQMVSNWELSTARSTELVRLLILRYGFPPERLSAAGYAEYHPIASNDTSQGRAQNRRVDVVILSGHIVGSSTLADAKPSKPSAGVP